MHQLRTVLAGDGTDGRSPRSVAPDPALAIVAYAKDVHTDLIVIGARAHRRLPVPHGQRREHVVHTAVPGAGPAVARVRGAGACRRRREGLTMKAITTFAIVFAASLPSGITLRRTAVDEGPALLAAVALALRRRQLPQLLRAVPRT
jgi:hypothetical protein